MEANYSISTDKSKLNIQLIHEYLSKDSYWAKGRTKKQIQCTIDNSICFGVYHSNLQVGFARVLTDQAVFAWLMDVFILHEYQGKGLGKQLMQTIIDYPDLKGISTFGLATKDAHSLYEQYGFVNIDKIERSSKYMFKSVSL